MENNFAKILPLGLVHTNVMATVVHLTRVLSYPAQKCRLGTAAGSKYSHHAANNLEQCQAVIFDPALATNRGADCDGTQVHLGESSRDRHHHRYWALDLIHDLRQYGGARNFSDFIVPIAKL